MRCRVVVRAFSVPAAAVAVASVLFSPRCGFRGGVFLGGNMVVVVEFLLPSLWEVQVAVVATAFVLVACWFFDLGAGDWKSVDRSSAVADANDGNDEMSLFKGHSRARKAYLIKVELLAAKNLNGDNLNGTSGPYAIITCQGENHVSSRVPGSRSPMWKEEFNFSVDELPAKITLTVYGLGVIQRSATLGSVTVSVEHEGQTGAIWHKLDGASGQVCLHINTLKYQNDSSRGFDEKKSLTRKAEIDVRERGRCVGDVKRAGVTVQMSTSKRFPNDKLYISRGLNGYTGAKIQRGTLFKQGPLTFHQKFGPLQTIFNLHPDEVVEHSYSCALERSFLYHGRLYISARHVCFHSNVFSKQVKIIIPIGDIDQIKKSQHALINPAITVCVQVSAGRHAMTPLGSDDGRVRYKFASFWNRSQTLRALKHAVKNYYAMLEAEQKEEQPVLLDYIREEQPSLLDFVKERQKPEQAENAESSSTDGSKCQPEVSDESLAKPQILEPFIREEILTRIYDSVFPCTVEQFFNILLDDASTFTSEYHTARKDFNVQVGRWRDSEKFGGQVREVTYRSLCNFPMCPPDIPVSEWQHLVLSADKKTLVFEIIQQTEGVPFASYFEVHCRWSIETTFKSLCRIDVMFGIHFKKWCILQSRIKTAAMDDNKKVFKMILDSARSHIKSRMPNAEIVDDTSPAP
ncbi:BAG-associated GRAM protein 1-like isoform X2 [Andrographis paniculata]|uniref:BAG-associated GRAM protein 1-like isoform X2 n=1 Tax=Andrographis paniculata TaxID=175694 RepID=UPI0021E6EEBA|nr:BAG-associated GRAM protein 1-like isoform X2 [Andrographis paniculata]